MSTDHLAAKMLREKTAFLNLKNDVFGLMERIDTALTAAAMNPSLDNLEAQLETISPLARQLKQKGLYMASSVKVGLQTAIDDEKRLRDPKELARRQRALEIAEAYKDFDPAQTLNPPEKCHWYRYKTKVPRRFKKVIRGSDFSDVAPWLGQQPIHVYERADLGTIVNHQIPSDYLAQTIGLVFVQGWSLIEVPHLAIVRAVTAKTKSRGAPSPGAMQHATLSRGAYSIIHRPTGLAIQTALTKNTYFPFKTKPMKRKFDQFSLVPLMIGISRLPGSTALGTLSGGKDNEAQTIQERAFLATMRQYLKNFSLSGDAIPDPGAPNYTEFYAKEFAALMDRAVTRR